MDSSLFAVAVVALVGSGLLGAASLRVRSVPDLVLAAYVIAYGELVVLSLLVSGFDAFNRTALAAGALAILAAAVGVWLLRSAPTPPRPALVSRTDGFS